MRIALFSEVYAPMVSGVSLVLQRLVGDLEQRGHVVRVYAPAYPLADGAPDEAHIFRTPSRRLFLYPDVRWGFPDWPAIRADFAAFRPDLVHVATEFAMGTTGMRLAREFEIPVIASAHTDYERYATRYHLDWLMPAGWQYLRWFYGQATRVLCPSQTYERHLHLRGVRHTALWSRGVDRTQFNPGRRDAAVRTALGIAPEQPMVLYVGRLAAEKNLELLIEAWQALGSRDDAAQLVVVGAGPLEDGLRQANVPGVVMAGMRTGEALAACFASADLFVLPSSTETFGNVLLEAMASGVAALAVYAGGVMDFATHQDNAWLVKPDSALALAEGINHLLGDPVLRRRLAAGGEATARGRDWQSILPGVLQEYERAVLLARADRAA
jgi:glycosyltransferase involved in cell wall biosynthesis